MSAQPWTNPIAPPVAVYFDNPMFLPGNNPQQVWETISDVVDDYFRIDREDPVRLVGNTLTEGRLDAFPEVGATILEPWRHDSADSYEKLESTVQSVRRYAQVRVIPAQGGFLVDVAVFKQFEDVTHPAHASAGAATFRNDSSLTRVVNPLGEEEIHKGWISVGRDRALEQRILAQLRDRFGLPAARLPAGPQPVPYQPVTYQPSVVPCVPQPAGAG
jgi:hypothetical protein